MGILTTRKRHYFSGYHLSGHKVTICSKNLWGAMAPPGYAYAGMQRQGKGYVASCL